MQQRTGCRPSLLDRLAQVAQLTARGDDLLRRHLWSAQFRGQPPGVLMKGGRYVATSKRR